MVDFEEPLDYYNPNRFDVRDGFGATAGRRRPHRGVDRATPRGTPIPSLLDGVISASEYTTELGWSVEVKHDEDAPYRYLGHSHLDSWGLAPGTKVKRGQVIGYSGNSGTATTGPHDHVTLGNRAGACFGVSMSYLTDPMPLIRAKYNIPTESPEGELMSKYTMQDSQARNGGRLLKPGEGFYLNTSKTAPNSHATNILGKVAEYIITNSIYAEGKAKDRLQWRLLFQTNPGKPNVRNSWHYSRLMTLDDFGELQCGQTVEPTVDGGGSPLAVYARLDAPSTNAGTVKVTIFDSTAMAFKRP